MIDEVIKNRLQTETQAANNVTVYQTEQILGSIKAVKDFGAFHSTHKKELEVARYTFLMDYCEGANFTPAELKAYRMGLDCYAKLFQAAEADTESYIREAEAKNRR